MTKTVLFSERQIKSSIKNVKSIRSFIIGDENLNLLTYDTLINENQVVIDDKPRLTKEYKARQREVKMTLENSGIYVQTIKNR
ncbi:hypothetical protein [Maribacter sp. 4G9]|uniref:hypothetical protein n=1 Tax=Maribacter sp. 4G9 TaxID=1889777 RepID=UPI000C15627C|nr:hypothetical protein [Maribacter sp. 4G9]PIB30584.1 hypothetical protein BFP75_02285 [Maribacter sp. 4G9]